MTAGSRPAVALALRGQNAGGLVCAEVGRKKVVRPARLGRDASPYPAGRFELARRMTSAGHGKARAPTPPTPGHTPARADATTAARMAPATLTPATGRASVGARIDPTMEDSLFTNVFLPLALAVIMLGMGMTLSLADFSRVVRLPKAALTGLGNQLLLLPLIGFLLALAFRLPPELAVGLMILAACPGGPTSNLISHLARGDTALSVSLTAVSSLVTVVTIPLLVNLSLHHFMGIDSPPPLPVLESILKILVITLVPVAIGMGIRARWPDFTRRVTGLVSAASAIFFLLVIAGTILSERDNIPGYFRQAGLAALTLNLVTMGIGWFAARAARLAPRQALTIAIESGLQNGTLAIAVAAVMLQQPAMAIPAAIYSLLMFASAAAAIGIGRRLARTQTQAPA